ncbi:hypothetical protein [Rickettsiella endosymbiont of Dermanyssus gallinae]|uniref:hypothetical protein n=1 Tax=Rickettsiella endosymbiont of Dermanyssus gallinae TaxID=2856608 RepID=UPI001C52DADD|nr:hypothetical protein [Rickettsiella endosymbiont of Dermanyssus gallinae]
MTAEVSLDRSVQIQQHLAELIHRTKELGKQVHSLDTLILPQLTQLAHQLEKEKKYARKFSPLYDREKFCQIIEQSLSQLNRKLLRLFFETRLFEKTVQNYQATVHQVKSEVANG